MTRAFVFADATSADAVNDAAEVIEQLFARAIGGGDPTERDREVAGLIADVWLANLTAFISDRASTAEARDHIERAVALLLPTERARN
jgi:hypothetical protein